MILTHVIERFFFRKHLFYASNVNVTALEYRYGSTNPSVCVGRRPDLQDLNIQNVHHLFDMKHIPDCGFLLSLHNTATKPTSWTIKLRVSNPITRSGHRIYSSAVWDPHVLGP